jgi:hypothetical protein
MEMQQLIVTQHEPLRYYRNAIKASQYSSHLYVLKIDFAEQRTQQVIQYCI